MKKIIYFVLAILAIIGFSMSGVAQIKTIPTTGTTHANPLTGPIEYRGPITGTALSDSVSTMYIGAGNRLELNLATILSRIALLPSGPIQLLAKSASGQSNLNLNPNSWSGSAINSASVTTTLQMTAQTASISSTYSLFPGLQYNSDLSTKFKKYSLIDSNFAATHYAPLSGGAYLPLSGGAMTGTGPITWSNGMAISSNGLNFPSGTFLTDGSRESADIYNRVLTDNSEDASIDWNQRRFYKPLGTLISKWSNGYHEYTSDWSGAYLSNPRAIADVGTNDARYSPFVSGGYLPLSGGTMTGNIQMQSNAIGFSASSYTSSLYVDNELNSGTDFVIGAANGKESIIIESRQGRVFLGSKLNGIFTTWYDTTAYTNFSKSSTAYASVNIKTSASVLTTPKTGDIWNYNNNLLFNNGTSTYTLNTTPLVFNYPLSLSSGTVALGISTGLTTTSNSLILANTAVSAGSYTAANITVDAQGRLTSASSAPTVGTNSFVLSTGATLTTPTIGVATATTINKVTITTPATSATLTIPDATALSITNTFSVPTNASGALTNDGSGGLTWVPDIGSALTAGYINVGNGSNVATAVLPSLSASAGTFSLATTGVLTMPNATTSLRGLLSSTDWNTFNGKQAATTFSGGVTNSSNTVTVDAAQPTITTATSLASVGTLTTGVWNSSTKIGLAYGGTNTDLSSGGSVGDIIQGATSTTFSRLASVSAGSYLRSVATGSLNVWSTLKLPNSATAQCIPFATSTNTWGEDANFTYTPNAVNALSLIGSNAARTSFLIQNTNSAGNASFYFQNDRGSFASYGGLLTGGSSDVGGTIFGLARADRTFLFSDGASSQGFALGTYTAMDLVFGTNNTSRLVLKSNGTTFVYTGSTNAANYVVPGSNVSQSAQFLTDEAGTSLTGFGGLIYGGTNYGSSSQIFGVNRTSKFFVCASGTNNTGMLIGTLTAQSLSFGTNNAIVSNFNSSGRLFLGGSTSATALIHLGAGTASASTAPLKFTSGTNLTTTEAGAVEYNGTHLFFTATNSGTRFQLDQQLAAGGDIVGTTTNNNAAAGSVGEYVESLVAVGSAVSFTTATAMNITSISLTAGDWDVNGQVNYNETVATVSARTASIGSTSATLATDGSEGYCGVQSTLVTEKNSIDLPRKRISVTGTTTIYLVASCTFAAGTSTGFGFMNARRVR